MKLTTKSHMKATKSGMTLLELTVVILVLLSLISILFIGARAWKRGSDRAASILQIRNVQQAVRSYANMNGFNPGDIPGAVDGLAPAADAGTALPALLFDNAAGDNPNAFMKRNPVGGSHPAGSDVSYEYGENVGGGTTIPEVGDLYITADDDYYAPATATITDW